MRFRDPRYTGTDRCWPCTILNCGLLLVAVAALVAAGRSVVGVLLLVAGGAAIWLRGYLVPGTPQVADRLPAAIRERLGKTDPVVTATATEALVEAGVLTDDLELSAGAATAVSSRARAHLDGDGEALEGAVESTFTAVTDVAVRRRLGGGENWFAFDDDEVTIRRWEARPVVAVDVAAASYLAETVPDWTVRSSAERTELLALVRYGVTHCPACEDPFTEQNGPRVVCCGGRSLVGERRCETCGYRLVDRNDLPTDVDEPGSARENDSPVAVGRSEVRP